MLPETPKVPVGPEFTPVRGDPTHERSPSLPTPEVGIERGAERREQAAETSAAAADAAITTIFPGVDDTATADGTTPVVDDTTPITANDDDVIEKEWVDKAKRIIGATKDDPHARGQQVGELQRAYLKKRYGKELGAAS